MTNLKEREKAFEAEYSRNQELAFRITARRNRLFGLWAAAKMGLAAGEAIETYAKDVIGKVRADLADKGVLIAEAELRTELARADAEARRQALAIDVASGAPTR
jgi:hypothetical protein